MGCAKSSVALSSMTGQGSMSWSEEEGVQSLTAAVSTLWKKQSNSGGFQGPKQGCISQLYPKLSVGSWDKA